MATQNKTTKKEDGKFGAHEVFGLSLAEAKAVGSRIKKLIADNNNMQKVMEYLFAEPQLKREFEAFKWFIVGTQVEKNNTCGTCPLSHFQGAIKMMEIEVGKDGVKINGKKVSGSDGIRARK